MSKQADLIEVRRRLDDMNDILAQELGLDPYELREMPATEALVVLADAIEPRGLDAKDIENWKLMCLGADDYADCFQQRLQLALYEPPSVALVVGASAIVAGAAAFAASWFR